MKPRPLLVLGLALGVLLLVPLWGAFGMLSEESPGHAEAGHGAMVGVKERKKDFIDRTKAFIVKNTRPDGCVEPSPEPAERSGDASERAEKTQRSKDMEGMDMAGMDGEDDPEAHRGRKHPPVYLQAFTWGYAPQRLCLRRGVKYEFKMMATDVTHGASIQMSGGSRMLRLPAGRDVEMDFTFLERGEYLIYCSYYCGIGHQFMKGQIIVE